MNISIEELKRGPATVIASIVAFFVLLAVALLHG